MKFQTAKFLGLATLLAAMTNLAHADATLFQDNFEGTNLSKWIGKAGGSHNGVLVSDPLNPTNHVLTFSAVNFAGDVFSATPLNVSRPRPYILKFDFLGAAPPSGGENGGFVGIASAPTGDSQQFWIAGTPAGGLSAPAGVATVLVADGQWHHYEIDITAIIDGYDLAQTFLTLEDWYTFGASIAGDAFFDNVKLVGVFDVNTIVAQVPCAGPAPGKTWKNHGDYVSTVSKIAEAYLNAGIITKEEFQLAVKIAGDSSCGNKK